MEERKGTYQAIWFIRQDLNKEKAKLLDSMSDMSLQYLGSPDDEFYNEWREEFTNRVEEINRILTAVETNSYILPEE